MEDIRKILLIGIWITPTLTQQLKIHPLNVSYQILLLKLEVLNTLKIIMFKQKLIYLLKSPILISKIANYFYNSLFKNLFFRLYGIFPW